MEPTFGDIYLTDFEPSIGHEYRKKRPALIVQEADVSKNSSCFTVMPISSKLEQMGSHDVFIEMDEKNRLTNDSAIKVQYICTFDRQRMLHFIGRAGSPQVRAVRGYLRKHFGL